MDKIDEIYKNSLSNIKKEKVATKRNERYIMDVTESNFYSWFFAIANQYVKREYPNRSFILDNNNKEVIQQLYYYLTANEAFKGDLNKSIVLCGGFGTGKTTICRTIAAMFKFTPHKLVFQFVTTFDLTKISKEELSQLYNVHIILDEIGRNIEVVNDYGTKRNPFIELMTKRYENQAFTIGTSNFTFETLKGMYGDYIGERMLQMFNFINLTGESRRK